MCRVLYAVLTEVIARSSAALELCIDLLGLPRLPSVDAPVFLTYSPLDYALIVSSPPILLGSMWAMNAGYPPQLYFSA